MRLSENSFDPPLTRKEFNEILDDIAQKLGHVVYDSIYNHVVKIGTLEDCVGYIEYFRKTDEELTSQGLPHNHAEGLSVAYIQGIHKSTLRSLTKDYLEIRLISKARKDKNS